MDTQFANNIYELLGLIDRLRTPLQERYNANPNDPEVAWIAKEVLGHLDTFEEGLKKLFDKRYDRPELAAVNKTFFSRTSRALDVFERYIIPKILRFDESDRFMTRVIAQWEKEINWPDKRQPFVIPDSNMFFVSFPQLTRKIAPILVPTSAADDIRYLVFDIHEMTHLLLRTSDDMRAAIQGNMREQVGLYFLYAEHPALQQHTEVISMWRDAWLEEFTCDMVATYVAGKAFTDQTLRSTNLMWETVFESGDTHPAWGARLAASAAVLRAMGHTAQARQVTADMMAHVARTGEKPDLSFKLLYPPELIQAIADQVVKGCKALDIKGFDQVSQKTGILGLINNAWDRFRADPASYRLWESGVLTDLRKTVLGAPAPAVVPIPTPVQPAGPTAAVTPPVQPPDAPGIAVAA
jgi:hypothetical protein